MGTSKAVGSVRARKIAAGEIAKLMRFVEREHKWAKGGRRFGVRHVWCDGYVCAMEKVMIEVDKVGRR